MTQNVPIIHRPTFDPGKDHILTLAIASIGACYSGLEGAFSFSNALAELTRRLLLYMVSLKVHLTYTKQIDGLYGPNVIPGLFAPGASWRQNCSRLFMASPAATNASTNSVKATEAR